MIHYYLLTEQIVDPASGEVLGRSGEENPERLMDYLEMYPSMNRPDWLWDALRSCYQSSHPFNLAQDDIDRILADCTV